jgi:hypothetical protein
MKKNIVARLLTVCSADAVRQAGCVRHESMMAFQRQDSVAASSSLPLITHHDGTLGATNRQTSTVSSSFAFPFTHYIVTFIDRS